MVIIIVMYNVHFAIRKCKRVQNEFNVCWRPSFVTA